MGKFDSTLFKSNQLIKIEGVGITSTNRLIYNYIINKLQKNDTHLIRLNIADFFNELKLGKNYDELIAYLESLQKIRVISRDSKGKLWRAFNLLSYFNRNEDGTFDVEIPTVIFNSLCNGESENKDLYYTIIKLLEEKSFKCSYTMIFYEIFKKYEKNNINIPIYNLETLKKITGTELKYKEYKDFKRYVLKKSLDELNSFEHNCFYTYEELKLSRKVDKIKFIKIINEKNKENEEQIKKQGANIRNITEETIKKEITKLEKLQNNEKTIEELKEMTSIQGIKKIPAEKKVMFFQKLAKIKTKEELKNFCDEYDILLNLQLFKI